MSNLNTLEIQFVLQVGNNLLLNYTIEVCMFGQSLCIYQDQSMKCPGSKIIIIQFFFQMFHYCDIKAARVVKSISASKRHYIIQRFPQRYNTTYIVGVRCSLALYVFFFTSRVNNIKLLFVISSIEPVLCRIAITAERTECGQVSSGIGLRICARESKSVVLRFFTV